MALFFTIMLGVSACILGYFSYYFNRGHYIQSAGSVIDTEMEYLSAADNHDAIIGTIDEVKNKKDRIYLLRNSNGRYIAGDLKSLPLSVSVLAEGMLVFDVDGYSYAAKVHTLKDGRTLLVGMDISGASRSYRIMQWLSLASIALMAIVVFVSFLISTFVVGRTNHIAETAKSIMETGDLSKRIVIHARWDDLSNMAHVLNLLLARVDELMKDIRLVSDNIAHDLRTPLTRLLNNLEMLRDRAVSADNNDIQDMCDAVIGETNRLLSTFNALLRITAIETRKQRQNFTLVNLDIVIADVIELYEPVAEERSIELIKTIVPTHVFADRDLLFQAAANILDNALKFTPHNGKITIRVMNKNDRPYFSIADTGMGIPQANLEKVFDRFYRVEDSRTTTGNGLGLSLVAAIVDLHKGNIGLTNIYPGLLVEVTL